MDDIKVNRQNAFLWAIYYNDLEKVKSLYDKKYIDIATKNDGLEEALDRLSKYSKIFDRKRCRV